MNVFTVDTEYGVFDVTGDYALSKLIREMNAVAIISEIQTSDAYTDSVKSAGRMPLEFGRNLLIDPLDTISGIPRGVSRLYNDIETNITNTPGPSEDDRLTQALAVSSYKRYYASTLGVDVYSSNPILQAELDNLGWAGALGSWSMTAAMLPFGGTAAALFKSTRLCQQFNNLLKEQSPATLRLMNAQELAAMGVTQDVGEAFLDSVAYTPRSATILVGSLATLVDARGRDAFVRFALSARDEGSAVFFQHLAETMRGYQEKAAPIEDIRIVSDLVFARAQNGSVLIPFPVDFLIWSKQTDRQFSSALLGFQNLERGTPGEFNLWVTGISTQRAREQFALRGVKVTERVAERIEYMD